MRTSGNNFHDTISQNSYQHAMIVGHCAGAGARESLGLAGDLRPGAGHVPCDMRHAGRRCGWRAALGAIGVGALLGLDIHSRITPKQGRTVDCDNTLASLPAVTPSLRGIKPFTSNDQFQVVERQIYLAGKPHQIRGVCWSPVPMGGDYPQDLNFQRAADKDLAEMQRMGINMIRVYAPLTDSKVLDKVHSFGMKVIIPVLTSSVQTGEDVLAVVAATKDHPAVGMWCLGNEWNYNKLYDPKLSYKEVVMRLNEAAEAVRRLDCTRPIVTSFGDVPEKYVVDLMPLVDVIGINVYDGRSPYRFGDRFDRIAESMSKPAIFTEYGVDAWNAHTGAYDPEMQAAVSKNQTEAIFEHSAARRDGVLSGGFYFEWRDEWWKMKEPWVHNVEGIVGDGMYDGVFNEEWFGLTDIDGKHRPVLRTVGDLYLQDAALDG